ncbi:hypothetical protein TorRG33x02_031250 [Trema orientale]|uniref:Uncharacterized protein n=1 Tax=Trema orientale TaxID=63057 RepID=A0A2P5FT37_TREOI|nr:hypothetical protein TorRG33x02_031250 [Trema orientale]
MSSNEYCITNRTYPMQFGTPADVGKRSATPTSSRSRHLHGEHQKAAKTVSSWRETDQLRSTEGLIDAATNVNVSELYVPEIIRID